MLATVLILIPLVFALLALGSNNKAKWVALVGSLLQLAITISLLLLINPWKGAEEQIINGVDYSYLFQTRLDWIVSFGIKYHVAIDGISAVMILLTNTLVPFIILAGYHKKIDSPHLFYALLLLMQSAMVGVFVAYDVFLYYIFWELALLPIYFIILLWGGDNRKMITFRFFIYTLVGSLLMLASIIYQYNLAGGGNFSWQTLIVTPYTLSQQLFILLGYGLAYAIKIPIWPLHGWQPATYVVAPAQGTMLLSAIMLKMALYSIIRWLIPVVPEAIHAYGDFVLIVCIAGVVYGSWIAIMQNNIKRLFAFSSMAHVGLIAAGIFTLSQSGVQGAIFQMLSHGVVAIGLFAIADVLLTRFQTDHLNFLGGIRSSNVFFASGFLVILFGNVALPLTSSFIGEFLLLKSIFEYNLWMGAVAGLTIIFGAVYMLRMFGRAMHGEPQPGLPEFKPLMLNEKIVLAGIGALILFLGVCPQFVFNLTEYSVQNILEMMAAKAMKLN